MGDGRGGRGVAGRTIDSELLERWCDGDKRAGSELIKRHYASVFRFFRSKRGDWAEDLAQRTFSLCVRQRDSFRRESSFRSFLFGIARNVLFHELRRRSRRRDLDFTTLSSIDMGLDASGIMVQRAEQRLLLQGLRSLPLEDQILLEMYRWEGLTASELSEVLEISVAAVRSRLRRAKERLRTLVLSLVDNPQLRESISGGFEDWVRSIRAAIDGADGGEA
ncbi:MAG: sigma-70 family RNA polymerase sigma factor [Myxococcales bacterium]|nr:sigma-70 family RNA polymerase sigma factor [Myxococcales bacterium]